VYYKDILKKFASCALKNQSIDEEDLQTLVEISRIKIPLQEVTGFTFISGSTGRVEFIKKTLSTLRPATLNSEDDFI
jgi:hypothetical protein